MYVGVRGTQDTETEFGTLINGGIEFSYVDPEIPEVPGVGGGLAGEMQQILCVSFCFGLPAPAFTLSYTLRFCFPSLDIMAILSVQVHCSQLWFKCCSFKCSAMPRGNCIVFSVKGLIPSCWPDHLNF